MRRFIVRGALIGTLVGALLLMWYGRQFDALRDLPSLEAGDRGMALGYEMLFLSLPWSLVTDYVSNDVLITGGLLLNGALAGVVAGAALGLFYRLVSSGRSKPA